MSRRGLGQRGASLIEALVALGVMAFGMLALVGLQGTLRGNADVSRQRAEAVRIAQAAIEDWRAFAAIETVSGVVDYADIQSDGPTDVPGTNATYVRQRVVTASASPPLKVLVVTVTWHDRSDEQQSVTLRSAIAGVPYELAGSLSIPPHVSPIPTSDDRPIRHPRGRHPGIPLPAKDLDNDTSVFKPPQLGGGTVAWVFDNLSGLIKGVCSVTAGSTTDTLTAADVSACSANTTAQLLSGFVRFASTAAQPNAAESEQPTGTALNLDMALALTSTGHPAPGVLCFDDATSDAVQAATRSAVAYYCIIYANIAQRWSGRPRVSPLGFAAAPAWPIAQTGAGNYKVCRYTPLDADVGAKNSSHPLDYTSAGSAAGAALPHQNFLVISAGHGCPTDAPATDDYFNANTRLHQDGSVTYDNP